MLHCPSECPQCGRWPQDHNAPAICRLAWVCTSRTDQYTKAVLRFGFKDRAAKDQVLTQEQAPNTSTCVRWHRPSGCTTPMGPAPAIAPIFSTPIRVLYSRVLEYRDFRRLWLSTHVVVHKGSPVRRFPRENFKSPWETKGGSMKSERPPVQPAQPHLPHPRLTHPTGPANAVRTLRT